jgi:hypothetical protein
MWENPRGREHSEDLGVDGRIILDLRGKGWQVVDWMHLDQDVDQWWAFVVMNLRVQ